MTGGPAARGDQALRDLAAEVATTKAEGWPILLLDDDDFTGHGGLDELLPAAERAAHDAGHLGEEDPLWWEVPAGTPGSSVLTALAAGLHAPAPRGIHPSVWVTDHLLRTTPLLVISGLHRLGRSRSIRTSPGAAAVRHHPLRPAHPDGPHGPGHPHCPGRTTGLRLVPQPRHLLPPRHPSSCPGLSSARIRRESREQAYCSPGRYGAE